MLSKPKVYRNYSLEDLRKAVEAVKGGTPCLAAAKQFNIPRITLMYKVSGKYSLDCKSGVNTVLTSAEEAFLSEWIKKSAQAGFPITKDHLLDSVAMIMKKLKRPNKFTNDRPGRHWYEGFLSRHPDISERMTENLTKCRANVSEENIRKWFSEIQEYFVQNNIDIEDPRRIFNADESAFFLAPKGKTVLAKKGARTVYTVTNASDKECITTLITGNASGELAPPMIMFSYARIPKSIILKCPDPTWALGKSDSGWMTSETFFEYITNTFHPWLLQKGIPLPIILYVDGHKSHLTYHLSEFCSKNDIILISLLPNTTHIMQPMDVGVFHPLKSKWKTEIYNWRNTNKLKALKKEDFAPLLNRALLATFHDNCKILQNAFRTTGLCPFNADLVDYSKIVKCNSLVSEPSNTIVEKPKPLITIQHLKTIEMFIEETLLNEFINQKLDPVWQGTLQHKSLYDVWKKMYDEIHKADKYADLDEHNTGPILVADDDIHDENVDGDILNLEPNDESIDAVANLRDEIRTAEEALGIHLDYNNMSNQDNLLKDEFIFLEMQQLDERTEGGTISGIEAIQRSNEITPEKTNNTIEHTVIETNVITGTGTSNEEVNNKDMHMNKTLLYNEKDTDSGDWRGNELQERHQTSEVTPVEESEVNEENLVLRTTVTDVYNEEENKENMVVDISLINEKIDSTLSNKEREKNTNSIKNKTEDSIKRQKQANNTANASVAGQSTLVLPIPSPFKSLMFWPEASTQKKSSRVKEKIPSVCSSEVWKAYYLKKNEEKDKKDDEIKERKRKREEKKNQAEEIKKVKNAGKQINKKQEMGETSGVVNTKIQNVKVNDYVVVNYEEQFYPGIVIKVNSGKSKFFIKVMTASGNMKWKWPSHPDEFWYESADIIEKIGEPRSANNRGAFIIPEMEKYL